MMVLVASFLPQAFGAGWNDYSLISAPNQTDTFLIGTATANKRVYASDILNWTKTNALTGNGQFLTNLQAANIVGTLTNNTTGNAVTASFASNGVTAMQSNILANAVTNTANLLTTNGNGQFLTNLQAANLVGNISASQVTGLPTTNTFVSTNGLFSGTLASSVTVPAAQVTGLPTTNTFASTNGTYPQMTVGTATVANSVNGSQAVIIASAKTNITVTTSGSIAAGVVQTANGATINLTNTYVPPIILTNFVQSLSSTNGYFTYSTNANGSIVATYVATNIPTSIIKGIFTNVVIFSPPPTSSISTGIMGSLIYSTNYLYLCVSNNSWLRCPMYSF